MTLPMAVAVMVPSSSTLKLATTLSRRKSPTGSFLATAYHVPWYCKVSGQILGTKTQNQRMDRRKTLVNLPSSCQSPVWRWCCSPDSPAPSMLPGHRELCRAWACCFCAWAVKDEYNDYKKTNECLTLLSFKQILMLKVRTLITVSEVYL